MREIKFRVWSGDSFIHSFIQSDCYHISLPFFDGVIQMYTGLKDKNGKEIYEGDVIKFERYNHRAVEKVEWFEAGWSPWHGNSALEGMGTLLDDIEIIGNIYENSELIAK